MKNNIPYSLTFKYFNDIITLKKDSPSLNIKDVMEMNKSIMITLFSEKAYKKYIIRMAEKYEYNDYEF